MSHRFARRVFTAAGIYGLVVLPPQYFLAERVGQDAPPPLTHVEFYYGFIGIAIAWQVAFLIIGRDPARHRALMVPAVLEKLAFGIPVVLLFLLNRVTVTVLGFATLDLLLAVLFTIAWLRTPVAAATARA